MVTKKRNKVSASVQTHQAVNSAVNPAEATPGQESQTPQLQKMPGQEQQEKTQQNSGRSAAKRIRKRKSRPKGWLESVTEDQQWQSIERLAGVARGAAIILWNLWDEDLDDGRWRIVAQGLSEALHQYADEVDVLCFQSAGDLARSMSPHFLAEVLQKEMDVITMRDRKNFPVTS